DAAIASAPYMAPRGAMEERLAAILRDVFRIERLGVDENFFDAGAHSLSIVQAHQRIRLELDADMPVVALFQYPTVASLAAHLTASAPPPAGDDGHDRGASRKAARDRRARARRRDVEPA